MATSAPSQGSLVAALGVVVLLLFGALARSLLGIAHLFGILVELGMAALIAFVALGMSRFLSSRLSAPGWLWSVAFALPVFVGSLNGGFLHDAFYGLFWLLAGIIGAGYWRSVAANRRRSASSALPRSHTR